MKYDEDALRALKYQGQTAGVQKAFAEAATMLDKYFVARSTRSSAVRPAAGQPNRGTNGQFRPGYKPDGSKASLDDLMNNPELMNPKYAER